MARKTTRRSARSTGKQASTSMMSTGACPVCGCDPCMCAEFSGHGGLGHKWFSWAVLIIGVLWLLSELKYIAVTFPWLALLVTLWGIKKVTKKHHHWC